MGLLNGGTGFVLGFAAGFGAGVVMKDHLPRVQDLASPLIKAMVKSGIYAAEKSREALARLGETLQDLTAEARMELKQRRAPPPARAKIARKRKRVATRASSRRHPAPVIPLSERRSVS